MAVASVEVGFSDLVDKLDFGALLHFEGRKRRSGFFVELSYFSLSDDKTIAGRPPVADGSEVHSALDQTIAEVGGLYRLFGREGGLELLFGGRLFDVSVDLDFDFPNAADRSLSRDESLLDGFAGLRYRGRLGERWIWWARGDAGAGGTDLSWQGVVGFGRTFGKMRDDALWIGYRHIGFDAEDEESAIADEEFSYSGPLIGYRFGF